MSNQAAAGVLLIRIWAEGDPHALRARITHLIDVSAPNQTVTFAASVEEITAEVARWLERFTADHHIS